MKRKLQWLDLFLNQTFFEPCDEHRELRKNEMNIYCVDCDEKLCQHCLVLSCSISDGCRRDHHQLLQIRRYVYQSVVRLHDISKLINCSKIQLFTVNSAKVVLLNPKNNGKGINGKYGAVCEICRRSISEPNRYCSISCKASNEDIDFETSGSLPSSLSPADTDDVSSVLYSTNGTDDDKHINPRVRFSLMAARRSKRKGEPRRSSLF